jgi:23S rRNA (cytosine1962-C5)-methyltransferase
LSGAEAEATPHPLLRLKPREGRRQKAGHPWVYSNEVAATPDPRALLPGSLVRLEGDDGWRFGTWLFNPHSLIAARRLDPDHAATIDAAWISARLAEAAALRAKMVAGPYHRLVHAEADRLPGLVIDRYDDVAVLQANTAGMDRLLPEIVAALEALRPWRAIVVRNDAPVRRLEGLREEVLLLRGTDAAAMVEEGGVAFPADVLGGQKTGWFFDQRPNRDLIAGLASGARVLDAFTHTGGFGLRAAAARAEQALLLDSSAAALDQARAAAERNGFSSRVAFRRGDAFTVMDELAAGGERFEVVVCDPPAFVRARKDLTAGLRAYARLARLAARLVARGGFLFLASCSHNVSPTDFAAAVAEGLHRAGREGRIVHAGGAGPDHPVHPQLPETAYLKVQLLHLS